MQKLMFTGLASGGITTPEYVALNCFRRRTGGLELVEESRGERGLARFKLRHCSATNFPPAAVSPLLLKAIMLGSPL